MRIAFFIAVDVDVDVDVDVLKSAIFIAILRPEMWTPDFWPQISHFSCRFEERNMKYGCQISGLESAIFIANTRPEMWMPDIWLHCCLEARNMDPRYLASNRPFSLPSRPEIWTPDFLPRIGNFHGHFEARNTDARFLDSIRPFSLPPRGQKYGRQISGLELAIFIAVVRPEIWTVVRPDIWAPDIWPQ